MSDQPEQQPQQYEQTQQTRYGIPPVPNYVPPQQQSQWSSQQFQPVPTNPPNKGFFNKKVGPVPLWIFILVIIVLIPIVANAIMGGKSNTGTTSFNSSSRTSTLGKTLHTFFSPNGATSTASLKWSPDGSTLQAVRMNGAVQTWDTASWHSILNYQIPAKLLTVVAWSPSGDYFATTNFMESNTIRVWNTLTGENILTHSGHTANVMALAWSPDGKRIASAGDDKTVQVWNAATGETLLTYHTDGVISVAWSPDGKRIASAGGDKTVQVWDAATGNRIVTYHGNTNGAWSVAWSPDGTKLASADYVDFRDEINGMKETTVQVWDAATGTRIVTYRGHIGQADALMWSPDGKRIASAGDDKTVQIWNASTGLSLFCIISIFRGSIALC